MTESRELTGEELEEALNDFFDRKVLSGQGTFDPVTGELILTTTTRQEGDAS